MEKEFDELPDEVKIYRNRMNGFYGGTVPQSISQKWRFIIEPKGLYSLGEEGVEIFLKKRKSLSETNLIYFAIKSEIEGRIKMANGFWKQAFQKSNEPPLSKNKKDKKSKAQLDDKKEIETSLTSFQELWFTLLREQKHYSCFSIFLVLPSDKEAIRYLTDYKDDLQVISSNTLVMTIGRDKHLHVDVNGKSLSVEIVKDYGKLANLFEIDFTVFPCMVVFEGTNPPNGIPIYLKGMTAEEIFEKMKIIFSIIQKSTKQKKSSVEALQQHKNEEQLKYAGKAIIGTGREYIDFALKTFIEILINAKLNTQSQ
jgi:hypothetical protein